MSNEPETITTKCRSCAETITSANDHFPFCSARCRMADLGKWFNEEYMISREIKDSDLDTVD